MEYFVGVYKDCWQGTTWFGKLTILPFMILCSPIIAILGFGLRK